MLYIHIPFCAKRCYYCDFHSGTDRSVVDKYILALEAELEARKEEIDIQKLHTIYIGGGTQRYLYRQQVSD